MRLKDKIKKVTDTLKNSTVIISTKIVIIIVLFIMSLANNDMEMVDRILKVVVSSLGI